MKTVLVQALFWASALSSEINWANVKPLLEYPELAGEAPDTFMIGGQEPALHQFPFMAALINHRPSGDSLCGGSLINNRAVLTSAVCIYGALNTIVVLGGHDLQSTTERFQARFRVQSTNYRIHPNFVRHRSSSLNDVAIVRLSFEIAFFNTGVRSLTVSPVREVTNLVMMGYGRTNSNAIANGYTLRYAPVSVPNICLSIFHLPFSVVHSQHICTTGNARSLCSGSLGGPLISIRNGIPTQVGIASFYSNNCRANEPSVFTSTFNADIFRWITENS